MKLARVLAMVLLALLAAPAVAQESVDVRARDLFVGGQYQRALSVYDQLYAQTHHPTYLRNIGRCHQMLGQPEAAIASFRAYLGDAHDLSPQERREIEGYIHEMQALEAARPPPSTSPRGPVAPPAATVAERRTEARPVTQRWWFWTAVGAVAVGGVVTAVALISHRSERLPCPSDAVCPP